MAQLLGITQSSFDPASRFRFIQFIPYLEKEGWGVSHRSNCPDRQWKSNFRNRIVRGLHYRLGRILMKLNRLHDVQRADLFDIVFVNRDLAGKGLLLEKLLLKKNPRIIYDFDDAIFLGSGELYVKWMCQNAAWVTPGNAYLENYARQYSHRVTQIPTVVDTDIFRPRKYEGNEPGGPLRLGWMGSNQSIKFTLFPYLDILQHIQKTLNFEFVIITKPKPILPDLSLKWFFWEWRADREADYAAKLDIGIMPLVDDEFQKGKCGAKLLQYMAAGLPAIASPVGVNQEILQHGKTGFLAKTPKQWHDSIESLVRSPELRADMGLAGRKRCEQHYSVRRWLPAILDIFKKVSEGKYA
jgi:glycosyltransferase involved in cell wall biosynthesis